MFRFLFISMAMLFGTLSAQTILNTIPASEGKLPTMEQLTPGHPAYIYAKSLLNASFDENGKFHYTLPEHASEVKPQRHSVKGHVSADKKWTALNLGDRLWVENLEESTEDNTVRYQVSDPDAQSDAAVVGQSDIVWGQSVHRNEFGIHGGIFWSPKGHQLAFYRMDQSKVALYPLLQTDQRVAEVKWMRYPMAGMTSHEVTLGIYNPDTKQTVYMKTNSKPLSSDTDDRHGLNETDHYLTNIAWCPNGEQILIAELNRLQNYMELNVYDVATGDYVRTLFTEQSDKYVEPLHPALFLPGSESSFIWLSQRDGHQHAYLYDLATAECQQLTQGNFDITELIGIDPKAKFLYFMSTQASPLESNLYCQALPKTITPNAQATEATRITTDPGVHQIQHNEKFTQIYDVYSNHLTPRICQLITLKNGSPAQKEVLYTAVNPFADCLLHRALARPEIEVGMLKAADGETDLYFRLVKPRNYLDGKKHPVIVYIYNGPHTQLITEGFQWGLPGWDCYMANKGYVVFTIDGRGSSNRGRDFEQAIWHNLGYNEGLDQMQGVAYLKKLPYVDPERIGIYGWSYGGFMTTYLKLNYPETFKVGVCGGPVLDWSRYEVMYGERYMGTPENNPEGYAANTLINQTAKLKGHLLLIHDDQDATVVPQISMQFLKKCVETGTYADYLLYMNHEHNVRGRDRVHLLNNIARYFDEHL